MPNLCTHDIDASIAFYRDALGFTQTCQFPREGQSRPIEFRLGDSRLALCTHQPVAEAGIEPSPGNPAELVPWLRRDRDRRVDLCCARSSSIRQAG